jgi:hypothetical protein
VVDIVTVEDVKTRMGLPDNLLEADDAIESALIAAENYIAGILDTGLQYQTGLVEVFFLTKDNFPATPGEMFRLRLKQAYVEDGTVTVTAGSSLADAAAVASTEYRVDLARGVVHMPITYISQYVEVTYSAGFQADDPIPEWLREATLAYIPGVLNTMQITNRDDEYKATMDESRKLASGILDTHLRGTAFHYRPVF